jgi:hypothetical protein
MSDELSIWCQSCAKRLNCEEVKNRTHDGHEFGVGDLAAYQIVRAYLNPTPKPPCKSYEPSEEAKAKAAKKSA